MQDACVIKNPVKKSQIHGKTKKDVLIVSEERIMRGFDFKAEEKNPGFSLLQAHSFSNKRALMQGLGRIARNGEAGTWYRKEGVESIDNS